MKTLQRADKVRVRVQLNIVRCERTLVLCDELLKSLNKRLDAANAKDTFNF